MSYSMIRGPFLLPETVAMLFKFVNGVSFQTVSNKQKFFMDSAVFEAQTRKMKRLQEILEEVCRELDPADPLLQWYFSREGTGQDCACLAQQMVHPFCSLRHPDFQENVREILEAWQRLQDEGYWISPWAGFSFTREPGCPGDLFEQLRRLPYPGDFLMKLYGTFRDFAPAMEQLARLLAPLARRLGEIYRQESWLFEVSEQYWREAFVKQPPLEFVTSFAGSEFVQGAGEQTLVAVSLMDTHHLQLEMQHNSPMGLDYNMLYIGGGIPANSLSRRKGGNLETMSAMLKAISDKRRMEILQRLSRKPSYGLELADLMGMDSGNMSRALAQLHSFGFLQEEKDRLRVYYRTDRDLLHNFLCLLEETLCEP